MDTPPEPNQPVESPAPASEETRAERRRAVGRIDLSSIIEEVEKEARSKAVSTTSLLSELENRDRPQVGLPGVDQSKVDQQAAGQAVETATLNIPLELEKYLPADLWRRLNGKDPARRELITALDRVRSVLYQISTFLPRHLVEERKRQPYPGRVKGQMLRGVLLFSDVSGFTALSERLAAQGPEGAELLTARMNEYFGVMLDILAESDGILLKFAGDALLAFFPAPESGLAAPAMQATASAAVRAGQRMLHAMASFGQVHTPSGDVRLKMKIGLAAGDFLAASLGTVQRMEYLVLGQAISDTMAAEGMTTAGGQMVLNSLAASLLPEPRPTMKRLKSGYYLLEKSLQKLDDFEIRAESRRARSGIPLNASPQAIVAQMEVALRQIQALAPYLAPELADRVLSPASRRGLTSQYRPTTVIFCNFTGPEQLLQAWGEGGVQRITSLLTAYFSAMNDVIARYGGIISRIDPYSKGTKLLALFGAPMAHEDDAQRAVSAALAMNIELELLNEAWQQKFARHLPAGWNQPLIQQRIGITYGQTFAGQVGSSTRREYTVMGDEVNLAARLMSAAEMGRILVSQPVQELAGEAFLMTGRPPMRVKGKSRPVQTHQVEGPQEDTLLRRIYGRGTLVGRSAQLAPWIEALRRCQQGQGDSLVIQGPPGVGKSHLADEMLKRAQGQGVQILAVRCRSYNMEMPLASWGQLFRLLAGIHTLDYSLQMQEEKFRRLLERLKTPPDAAPLLASLSGFERRAFENQVSRQPASRIFDSGGETAASGNTVFSDSGVVNPDNAEPPAADPENLAALVKTGRRRGSQLDMLDRLTQSRASATPAGLSSDSRLSNREREQLSSAVWEALSNLTQAGPAAIFFEDAHFMDPESVALLETIYQRIEQIPLLVLLARRGEETEDIGKVGRILRLRPLEQAGTYQLVANLLVSELAQVIYEQTQGNPLQVSEITHWFMRTHGIHAEELKSVLQTSDFLQKMVLSSVEEMPEIRREIIRAAAVIGQEFRASEVQALLPRVLDPVTLNQHLRALMQQTDLIRSAAARMDPIYTFQQTLVRDILYNSLPYEQRRTLHDRFAEYLSRPMSPQSRARAWLAGSTEDSQAPVQNTERIAYHYEQAAQWLLAARCWLSVAQQAQQNRFYDRAANGYSQVLENTGHVPEAAREAEVLRLQQQAHTGLGDTAFLSGDFVNVLPSYEAAAACSAGAGLDANLELPPRLALGLAVQGKMAEAQAGLQASLGQPDACTDLVAAGLMAWLLWRLGKREARRWIQQAQVLAALDGTVNSPEINAMLQEFTGDWDLAVVDYYQQHCWLGAGLALLHQGQKLRQSGNLSAAQEIFQHAAVYWQAVPEGSSPRSLALYLLAEVAWLQQDVQAARQVLQQAHAELGACPPGLLANGQAAIQRALKVIEKKSAKRWPAWEWQAFDDQAHAAILFGALLASRNGQASSPA